MRRAWIAATDAAVRRGPQRRFYNAVYGRKLREHEDVVADFAPRPTEKDPEGEAAIAALTCKDGAEFVERAMPLLDRVEDRLAQWKLAKWEFRVPSLLEPGEKESAKRQLAAVRCAMLDRIQNKKVDDADLLAVSHFTGNKIPLDELRTKTRAWVEQHVSQLRWEGDIAAARQIREAWLRLENRGGPQKDFLQRLCYVYALGRLGTFDDAFANTIVPSTDGSALGALSGSKSHKGNKKLQDALIPGDGHSSAVRRFKSLTSVSSAPVAQLDETNVLEQLLQLTLVNMPSISTLHDFIGLNQGVVLGRGQRGGYRDALGTYMTLSIRQQLSEVKGNTPRRPDDPADETRNRYIINRRGFRVPKAFAALVAHGRRARNLVRAQGLNRKGEHVILFDYRTQPKDSNTPMQPSCDFMLVRGNEVTLITIASHNRYLREVQIVGTRQAQGIARRAAMVTGGDINTAKCRTLLLPPSFLDRTNLRRLHRVLGIDGDLDIDTSGKSSKATKKSSDDDGDDGGFEATGIDVHAGQVEADLVTVPRECAGWVRFYDKELSVADEDYAKQSEHANAEAWVTL
jgi:hypothetical protein